MTKSIAVLGLGKYGMSLVRTLNEMGVEVLAVDRKEGNVNEIADSCTAAVCADLTIEDNLLTLGLKDMDIVVVAMGQNLEASILSVVVCKELGVPKIVAKSSSKRMAAILRKVGADTVIMPEEHAGMRSAAMLVSDAMLDYFQVDNNLCLIEMRPLEHWVGKSPAELNLQTKFHINVVAEKSESSSWVLADSEHPLAEKTELLVAVERKNLSRLKNKLSDEEQKAEQ